MTIIDTQDKIEVQPIIYESKPTEILVEGIMEKVHFSDHSPVIAQFKISTEKWEEIKLE